MKTMFVIYTPVYGGPHNTIERLAPVLAAQGISSLVVLPDDGHEAAARLRSHGLDVVTMPLHRIRATKSLQIQRAWLAAIRKETRALSRLITDRRIDVVINNSLPNVQAGLAAHRAKVACVWVLFDSYSPIFMRAAFMPLVRQLSDVIMTTGHRIAEQHPGTRSLRDRWISFYPCVDTDRFAPSNERRRKARQELGLTEDALVIGNVANLNPMKGHVHFVRAAAMLLRSHPKARFVILGAEYPHRKEYIQAVWTEARRLGVGFESNLIVRNPDSRVADLAPAFDQFWMTSEPRSEGIPTVIGEAKALGMPIIAADVGSTREAVSHGVSGFLVPPRAPAEIARRARYLLDHPDVAAEMGRSARAEAVQQFSTIHGAAAYRLAYERAIAHARSRFNNTKE